MSHNNKAVWRIVYFSVFFLIVLTLFYLPAKSLVFSYLKQHPENKIKYVIDKKVNAEMMIWGASTAEHHLNAPLLQRELNRSVFNMGEDGFVFDQYRGMLKEYLNYANPDNTLVLVVSVFDFAKRKQIARQSYFLPYLEEQNIQENLMEIDRGWTWKNSYVPFYKLINWDLETYKSAFRGYITTPGEKEDTLLGFSPLNKPEHFIYDKNIEPISECSIDSTVVRELIQVLNSRPSTMKSIIVLSPIYNPVLDTIKGLSTFKKAVAEISMQTRSTVYDYLGRPEFRDSSLFCYNAHLNAKGADTLTRIFLNDFKNVPGQKQLYALKTSQKIK